MGAGRIYWGQILVFFGVLLAGAAASTQWCAHALGHQALLGPPDALVWGMPVYAPWKVFLWWYHYDAYARPIFETAAGIFLVGALLAVLSAIGFSLWRSREAKQSDTYGSARWATTRDIQRLKLTSGDGVILGAWGDKLLRHDGDEHVLVVAPTNTGKSVGVSLPTGLVWRHSYVALDLKGENWNVTSGLRAAFGPVFRFAPAESGAHRYNPLTQIRRGDNEVRDAQILVDMLVDPEGALRERSHWQLRAFELLVAVILWALYAEPQKTLARIAGLLADPQRPIIGLLEDMLQQPIKDGAPHPVVAAGARQLLDMAEAERSGVVSTALGYLALYRDPVLARATEVSDFSIEDIISGARPVSLYLVVPPEEISRLKALLRLVLNQMLKRLTEIAAQQKGSGRRVLLMLDEFPQLGKLDFFEHALAYIRGYRIKACLVAQSLNQVAQAYGEHSSILDNAHIRVAYACNDERTAKRISDMLGVTTETRAQMNYDDDVSTALCNSDRTWVLSDAVLGTRQRRECRTIGARVVPTSEDATMQADLSATDRAYNRLREDILSGALPVGPLDLRRISDLFRMSVTPVREALARLSAERFVKREPHGYAIATPSPQRIEQLYQIGAALLDLSFDQARRTSRVRACGQPGAFSHQGYSESMTALLRTIATGQANVELTTYLVEINDRLLPARRQEPGVFPNALQDLSTLRLLWERRDYESLRVFLRSYHETRIERVDVIARRLASEADDR